MKTIYSISKTGKILTWSALLSDKVNSNGFYEITITSGQLNGKKINKVRYVKSGKNIGRSNETSLCEQAQLEHERLYTKQYDLGYKDDVNDVCITKQVNDIKKPMLADKYPDKIHKLSNIDNDIIVQPKIDGIRCFIEKMETGYRFTSRSGKPIKHIENIINHLPIMSVGDIFDGELYIENEPLQTIMSVVSPTKNIKESELTRVKFYWYDFIQNENPNLSYDERFINNKFSGNDVVVKLKCDNYTSNFIELNKIFDRYISEGYEGMMIRNTKEPYYFGRRSTSLLKYKKMQTDEFLIVDIIESDNEKAPRFICDLGNGNTVTVRMTGDKDNNLIYLENKNDYIGCYLTIQYQTWTKTGSLQFPVGIMVRSGVVKYGVFNPYY